MSVNAFNYATTVKGIREQIDALALYLASRASGHSSTDLYALGHAFDGIMDEVRFVQPAIEEADLVDETEEEGEEFLDSDRYMFLIQDLEAEGFSEEEAHQRARRIIRDERIIDEW